MISRRLAVVWQGLLSALVLLGMSSSVFAGEADINIPPLDQVSFNILGATVSGLHLMWGGIVICFIGMIFGWIQYQQTKALPVHECMAKVSHSIWETCKTYLFTQGKFLAIRWMLIAACIFYYFKVLQGNTLGHVIVILLASILGILGSYGVA
ncbi:MAG: sodium-translocating pyrophosphatase, partial [Kiritimatiellae bacterium]|nr:sodium-translocating pyrophosphatase [Kiritimatiellia bacterium]